MNKSIIFDEDDLIPHTTGMPVSVKPVAFMDKVMKLIAYETEYSQERYLKLKDAEMILLWIRENL